MSYRDSFLDGFDPADAGNTHDNGYRAETDPFISALYDDGMISSNMDEGGTSGDSFLDGFDPDNDINVDGTTGTVDNNDVIKEADVDEFIKAGIAADGDVEYWERQRELLLADDDEDEDIFLELEDNSDDLNDEAEDEVY